MHDQFAIGYRFTQSYRPTARYVQYSGIYQRGSECYNLLHPEHLMACPVHTGDNRRRPRQIIARQHFVDGNKVSPGHA